MSNQKQEYYQEFANHLARQIVPSGEIKSFIGDHPALVGDFAEAQVRKFVQTIVHPLNVSCGAVIAPESYETQRAKQVDTIIWTSNPLPPLVQVGDFALVPRVNSMGILEIKSTAYSGTGRAIAEVLDMECDLTCGRRPAEKRGIPAALGVIVLRTGPINESKLKELIDNEKVVVLIRQEGSNYIANTDAVLKFVNHLAGIRRRARQLCDLVVDPLRLAYDKMTTATSMSPGDGIYFPKGTIISQDAEEE